MKINQLIITFLVLIGLLNIGSDAQEESKKLIYGGARQGTEWTVYLLNKKLAQEVNLAGETRRLYLVDLEIDNSDDGISRKTNLIQCSTIEPFIAFKDDYEQQMAVINFLNLGGEIYGYNSESHWLYWAICHDIFSAWEYDLKSQALQLGYSPKLKSQQIRIPYGLMQNLK